MALAAAPAAAQQASDGPGADRPPVQKEVLENGLTVLVLQRTTAPTAALTVQFRVGGVDERPGETGIAHLLEHLLFKGTRSVGTSDPDQEAEWLRRVDATWDSIAALGRDAESADERAALSTRLEAREDSARTFVISNQFDEILARNGARGLNAMTTAETTTYFVEVPSNAVELWFLMEGDRMTDPVFREFFTERDVVLEERRLRVDSDPAGRLYEAHMAEAFRVHPYGQPVVGTRRDLESLSRPQVEAYYRRFYGAANAVVTVVGDVEPDSVFAWARTYLGGVPRGEAVQPVQAVEPRQSEERRISVRGDGQPALRMGWRTVPGDHPDAPALVMASAILTGGRTSRMYRQLVQSDRLAAAVSSSLVPGSLYPALFALSALPAPDRTVAEVDAAIQAEIARLASSSPDVVELDRVKRQLEATRVRRLRTNLGLALQLAEAESLRGDWRWAFDGVEALLEVQPDDVRRVVARYLTPGSRTLAILEAARE
jgi:predicted Zn-dependent peptidase